MKELLYRDFLIFSSGVYLWLVHIVGGDRREEIGPGIFWSDIVGVGIRLITLPDIVLRCEDTIGASLDMCPSVPVSVFTTCVRGSRALCLEYSSYRSPATWDVVLEREIVFVAIAGFWCDGNTDSVE